MKIQTGDTVKVLIGKDKNRQAKILKVLSGSKAIVDGLNVVKKHLKASSAGGGGLVDKSVPLALSKLILICPNCQKPTRVGFQIDQSGQKYRICKKCQKIIKNNRK